ncbi:dTDP-4-dehydrorhamnose reductase [Sulfuricella denitrificans skB26]|uniref:dTDP-4-dehydrorhamnose reductase n=1 Tax=Sulfuricella denitrificans (strain DSM 22764 / NBRC 105220 / skB26) TaxID=1163617 RepID=S6AP88_SULDS|nr:dTDP-4-dehydrorhamnose reductase [Sulfuricella denitrificans]BAN36709.1 dTDP-4-dehydrorhamnose reductase [Sulfuricella denitrificans skB26]
MKKILLVGKNGQVGWELQRTLATLGDVVAIDRQGMDLANPDSIRNTIRAIQPNLIVNAAAYTAVDKAESEPELAMAINGVAPGIMAEEAKQLGATMVHYSTDYVFDGTKTSPYTEEDIPNPLSVYGKTKLAGEHAVQAAGIPYLIFRTSWVYGLRGRNFLLTILRLAKERDELRIVDDQIGAPTWSRMIAEATGQVLGQGFQPFVMRSGIYNLTAAGQTSWHGFTRVILENVSGLIQPLPHLIPLATSEYPLPAPRPPYSTLSSIKLNQIFGVALPDWDASLTLCMDKENIKQCF